MKTNETVAVVGAGMSGLLVARVLKARGVPVVVLEKNRVVGGRLATKRVGTAVFELATLVVPSIERWLGADVADVRVHRWKLSEPATTYRDACLWIPDLGLGFAGDAFGGPRVEGAAVSGLELADRITGDRRDRPSS